MSREYISDIFNGNELHYAASWQWVRSDFADDFHALLDSGAFTPGEGSEVIWRTRHKYTLKITAPSGRVVAFKHYDQLRGLRKFVASPTFKEAVNYQQLTSLGLPMAQLLAVGDERSCFTQKSSFLITEFAQGFLDGRDFYPGARLENERALLAEFTRRNFELLAVLHDAGICHRGFTPANELWKKKVSLDEAGNQLDIVWIDVSSCRRESDGALQKEIPDDFVNFLRFFDFTIDECRTFVQAYCNAAKVKRFEFDALVAEVDRRLAARKEREG